MPILRKHKWGGEKQYHLHTPFSKTKKNNKNRVNIGKNAVKVPYPKEIRVCVWE